MAVLTATGLVVAKRQEKREFMNAQGKPDSMDIINVYLADAKAEGDPIQVQVSNEQFLALDPYKGYSLPIEVNVFLNKKGVPVTSFRCHKFHRIGMSSVQGPPAVSGAQK